MGKLPLGTGHVRYIFRKYRQNALKRGIDFNLSIDQLREITTKNCYYCGSVPSIGHSTLPVKVPLNGIDRTDSSKGYEMSNCVPACSDCNKLKSNRTIEEFTRIVGRICEHLKILPEKTEED